MNIDGCRNHIAVTTLRVVVALNRDKGKQVIVVVTLVVVIGVFDYI